MNDERQWRAIPEVYHLFGYKSAKSALNAIARKTFPVKTYLLANVRVVDVRVMDAFFQQHRDEGMEQFSK